MQSRSDLWKEYAVKGNIPFETVAVIDGTEYPASSAPVIERGAFSSEPTIGGCVTASLQISILTDDDISKSAEVAIKARYVNGDEATEWLEEGTFYVSKRSKDYSSGLLSLTCYDKMLMTNKDYFDSDEEGVWPQAMSDTVTAIADWLEVEIDDRTVINTGDAYYVPCPTGLTVMQVLGHIAEAHGGNWIITPQGKLRLVPLAEAQDGSTDDEIEVVAVLGTLTQSSDMAISGITVEGTDGTSYTAGDDSGYTVTVTELPCASQEICDDLYTKLGGLTYRPFEMTQAIYDPAAEIGDTITYAGQVRSILYCESATLNVAHRATASAPSATEAEDEYPYLSSTAKLEKAITQVSSSIESTAASVASSIVERTQESILATVSKTYATQSSTLSDTKAYFALSESADECPDPAEALEDGEAALADVALADIALVGVSGWMEEMPDYEDGDYVWVCYHKTYADGSEEWTEPELIVDGSMSASIFELSSTTASIKIQADSILQSITTTNATWDTGGYAVAATACGTPADMGYKASAYEGLYYLDQSTGHVYLSDGKSWSKVAELEPTAETMETLIGQTATSILNQIAGSSTTWDGSGYDISETSYGTPDEAEFDAAKYEGLYYLDQSTGYVYLSDGTAWAYVDALPTMVDTISASLVLSVEEETDEDGITHKYGALSGEAEYIKFTAGQFIVDAGNFSIDEDGIVTAGNFTIGETAFYSGKHSEYDSDVNGVYVGTDYISLGSEATTFFKADGTGKIGGLVFDKRSRIYCGTDSFDSEEDGMYISARPGFANSTGIRMVGSEFTGTPGIAMLLPNKFSIQDKGDEMVLETPAVTAEGHPFMEWDYNGLRLGLGDTTLSYLDCGGELMLGGFIVPKIQHGSLSISSITTSAWTSFSVTFSMEFESTPDVAMSVRHLSAAAHYVKLGSVSTTGFTGYYYASNGTSVVIHWTAMC